MGREELRLDLKKCLWFPEGEVVSGDLQHKAASVTVTLRHRWQKINTSKGHGCPEEQRRGRGEDQVEGCRVLERGGRKVASEWPSW